MLDCLHTPHDNNEYRVSIIEHEIMEKWKWKIYWNEATTHSTIQPNSTIINPKPNFFIIYRAACLPLSASSAASSRFVPLRPLRPLCCHWRAHPAAGTRIGHWPPATGPLPTGDVIGRPSPPATSPLSHQGPRWVFRDY